MTYVPNWIGSYVPGAGFPISPITPEPTTNTSYNYSQPVNSGLGLDWLAANPEALYRRYLSGLNMPMRRFFESMYGNIYNEYQGALAGQAQGGGLPTMKFGDFLSGIDWTNRYYSYSPYQRGFNQSKFAPPTRYLNY
jgi:hypothetical protein